MSCTIEAATRDEVSEQIIELFKIADAEGPHGLRKAMADLGASGVMRCSEGCVIANYLAGACPGWKFSISDDCVYGWTGDDSNPDDTVDFKPPTVQFGKFINWFDRGLLEELLECPVPLSRAS